MSGPHDTGWTDGTPLWWPPAAPATADPAPARADAGRSRVATAIALVLVSALVTAAVMSRVHWPDTRPTNTAAVVAPSTPAVPGSPFTPARPANPFFGTPNTPTAPGTGSDPSAAAVAAKVNPGIVDINTRLGLDQGTGAGTGMILTSSGDILTNNHVIDGATSITVTRVDNGRTATASVVGTDPTDDVAVIRITGGSDLTPVTTTDSDTVSPGDTVFAIGNAGGVGGTPSIVTGIVQAVNQTITASDPGGANAETLSGLIQVTAPIQAGDSGGALVNAAGQVIGMNTAASAGRRFRVSAGIGFAIPINHALAIAREIEAGHASGTVHIGVPGFLGVAMSDTAVSTGSGAVISGVQAGSPAAKAGLVAGDTVTAIDKTTVDSAAALSTLVKGHRPGDKVAITWVDQSGRAHTATVTLAEGPPD